MNQMFDLMPERVYNHQSYVRNESVVRPNAWKICSDISGDSASEQEQSGRYEDKIKMNKQSCDCPCEGHSDISH